MILFTWLSREVFPAHNKDGFFLAMMLNFKGFKAVAAATLAKQKVAFPPLYILSANASNVLN